MDDEFLTVLIDQETRWLSMNNMIQRFLTISPQLYEMALRDKNIKLGELLPALWSSITTSVVN